ncbi:S8 family serine peptidase [Streptomyces sp. TRM66268-LWL]|uniref:S8 family serine peptidase n=1 Tax=Streptomyces polyasparticus TaxID=2767826 RepID=A0ABR7SRQ0_9ACTN|nr:S8 family serine peptidase [Streptomyces polyasparticus]MBC9718068.1 S8 family serine peptidase [Streptomyces polyasparticus]
MARRRRSAGTVAATAVALLATGLPQAGAAPGGEGDAVNPRDFLPPATKTVTLLSGDKVSLTGSGEGLQVTAVKPGEGREHVAFSRARVEGREYVIPVDATDALAQGRLDRALFDVTTLAAEGYDDASRTTIPLIATEQTELAGAARRAAFDGLGLTARTVKKSEAAGVWRDFLEAADGTSRTARGTKLWLDGKVEASLDKSVPMTGAPEAWKSGLDGKGVQVAVLDSGTDATHPDIKDRLVAQKDFTWDEDPQDFNGHGTHVASTIVGGGQASGGRYKGVAPGAELINGKVLDGGGSGYISWILDGMQWAKDQGADIVSMSLGSDAPSDGSDPLSQAVEQLSADGGPLFVIAAGNAGRPGSVGSPGVAPSALTVGSITKQGEMSSFSSQGPVLADAGVKPEITAPGSEILAARAKGTHEDAAGNENYLSLSGTSMATPHVSGAAAILKQKHPDWDAQQLKAALVGSADPVREADVYAQGAGSVDIPAALDARVQAAPAAVSAKLQGDAAADVTREVTYRNSGTRDARLSLALDGEAPVSLSTRHLTVPAGGSAKVTVTIDADRAEPGTYGAWITARGSDGSRVRTPVGIQAEPDSATLTLAPGALRDGVSRTYTHVVWQNEKTGASDIVGFTTGSEQVTLPEGDYRLLADVWEYRETAQGVTTAMSTVSLAEHVRLDGDESVTIDVSDAKPVELGVDDPAMRVVGGGGAQGLVSDTGTGPTGMLTPIFEGDFKAYAVQSERMEGLSYFAGGTWAEPLLRATTLGDKPFDIRVTPYFYARIHWDVEGEVVDAGTGKDLDGLEIADKIVLFTPEREAPGAERTRRYQAIMAEKPAAVIFAGSWLDAEEGDNILVADDSGATLLRQRLADGPLRMEIVGKRNSEDVYFTFHHSEDGVPGGARWTDRKQDLAAVAHSQRTTGYPNDPKGVYGWVTYEGVVLAQQQLVVRAPHRFTGHYTPGLPWTTATFEYASDEAGALGAQYTAPTVYEAGSVTRDHWLSGPFGPALGVTTLEGRTPVARDRDRLRVDVPMFSDAAGHRSESVAAIESGVTELRDSDGELVGRNGYGGRGLFDLPAQSDWYTLSATAERDDPSWYLGTKVGDTWKFRSGRTSSSQALPLLDVRYDVAGLDGDNSVAVGEEFGFGVSFPYQAGSRGAPVNRVSVAYSTDDGSTWAGAEVSRGGSGSWNVTVPGVPESQVSLRVTATATDGTSVTETVTRAYKSGCPNDWCSYAPPWPGWN